MGILERDEAIDEGEHGAGKGGANPGSEGRAEGASAVPGLRLPPELPSEATPSRGATGFDGRVTGSLWLARDGVFLPLRETWRGWRCIWPYTC